MFYFGKVDQVRQSPIKRPDFSADGETPLTPAYKYDPDPEKETQLARSMLERAIGALNHLSPQLKFVVFPTGTKVRGLKPDSFPKHFLNPTTTNNPASDHRATACTSPAASFPHPTPSPCDSPNPTPAKCSTTLCKTY